MSNDPSPRSARYRVDPKPQYIFFHTEFCGRVGNASALFHCPICGRAVYKVLDDPNPAGWDYICLTCNQLIVPRESTENPEYMAAKMKDAPAGAIGILISVPVRVTFDKDGAK